MCQLTPSSKLSLYTTVTSHRKTFNCNSISKQQQAIIQYGKCCCPKQAAVTDMKTFVIKKCGNHGICLSFQKYINCIHIYILSTLLRRIMSFQRDMHNAIPQYLCFEPHMSIVPTLHTFSKIQITKTLLLFQMNVSSDQI